MSYFYEASGVEAHWAGEDLSVGFKSLVITPNADRVTTDTSADGKYGFSKMGDKGCTITMTFQQTNPIHKKIAKIAAAQDVIGATLQIAPFTVVDKTGDSVHFACFNAVLTAVPENSFEEAMGEKTWTWVAESYLMAEDPSTIKAALSSYLRD